MGRDVQEDESSEIPGQLEIPGLVVVPATREPVILRDALIEWARRMEAKS